MKQLTKYSFLLIISILGLTACNTRFSALSEPVSSQIELIVQAEENMVKGYVPLNKGCAVEVVQLPIDGILMINPENGEFTYIYQNLTQRVLVNQNQPLQDKFAYRENCGGDVSYVKVILINL